MCDTDKSCFLIQSFINRSLAICSTFFNRYGEIVNINMVRDKKTGKTKGFAFICYQDQRSTILAVDNFNGTKVCLSVILDNHMVKD